MLVKVLCIDHLHEFVADPGDESISCPDCGCRHVRRARQTPEVPLLAVAPEVTVKVLPGRHMVGGDTWLSSKGIFQRLLNENPNMTDGERRSAMGRAFPGEKDNG